MTHTQAYWSIKIRLAAIRDELQHSSAFDHNCQRIDEALQALDVLRPQPDYHINYKHEVLEVDLEQAQQIHDAWIDEHAN